VSEFLASSLSHVRHIEANGDLFLSHPQTQNRPLPVPQTQSAFHPLAQRKRFPSSRCASAIQIVRPAESRADTQPQLQLALIYSRSTTPRTSARNILCHFPCMLFILAWPISHHLQRFGDLPAQRVAGHYLFRYAHHRCDCWHGDRHGRSLTRLVAFHYD